MKLCLVDTSWLMWTSLYSNTELTAVVPNEEGVYQLTHTGHIFGILRAVPLLSQMFDRVIMVMDSPCVWRKEIYSGYKEGRHTKVKDGDDEFNPYQHMDDIISAATSFPNVWAAKKKGEEADDIIATFIQQDYNPWIFSRDNDLLQTQKPFQMFTNVMGNEVVLLDKEEYIKEKYELELPFLPIWWKVARGDSSDKIPAGAPRIRKTELIPLCMELKDTQDFDVFMEAFRKTKYAERKNALGIDLEEDLRRNYDLVMPHYLNLDDLEWRKTPDKMSGYAVCSKYNMVSLSDFYVRV